MIHPLVDNEIVKVRLAIQRRDIIPCTGKKHIGSTSGIEIVIIRISLVGEAGNSLVVKITPDIKLVIDSMITPHRRQIAVALPGSSNIIGAGCIA